MLYSGRSLPATVGPSHQHLNGHHGIRSGRRLSAMPCPLTVQSLARCYGRAYRPLTSEHAAEGGASHRDPAPRGFVPVAASAAGQGPAAGRAIYGRAAATTSSATWRSSTTATSC